MGDLSVHFSRGEFACHCGCGFGLGKDDTHPHLIEILETVREFFDSPISITSGCRCAQHNAAVGGEPNSYHMRGMAADIKVKDIPPAKVAEYLERNYPDSCGIGRYRSWVHVDCRNQKARWKK